MDPATPQTTAEALMWAHLPRPRMTGLGLMRNPLPVTLDVLGALVLVLVGCLTRLATRR